MTLFAVSPLALGGIWLRARAGPVRDGLLHGLDGIVPLPLRKLHPGVMDDALFGGLDLGATLAMGQARFTRGLLAERAVLMLTMAERCPPGLAARLAQGLDRQDQAVIALDEGAEADERAPGGLLDRLGLFADLDGIVWSDTDIAPPDSALLAAARTRLPGIACPDDALRALTLAAARMGIGSLRAPLHALAAARAHAAWRGAAGVEDSDLALAAALVLAHRGLAPPEEPDGPNDQPEEIPPDPDTAPEPDHEADTPAPATLDDMLVAAARAALPPDLLAQLAGGARIRGAKGSTGTGAQQSGNRRGRPLPARPGRLQSGTRIDLVATLRAAAPWQALRRAHAPTGARERRLFIRPTDIRLKRFQDRSDRVLVFAVDASGSAATARLAEAKGAVELLLAAAYARRDYVALIAFRGTGAEVLLPPTRSLVQTKRRLADLPGGGGTPLAAGLQAGMLLATQVRARGMTPTLAVLTDGRGNIALTGQPGRAEARSDAHRLARLIAASKIHTVVIDTSLRPQPALRALAADMGAACLDLPRADAEGLSRALSAALDDVPGS